MHAYQCVKVVEDTCYTPKALIFWRDPLLNCLSTPIKGKTSTPHATSDSLNLRAELIKCFMSFIAVLITPISGQAMGRISLPLALLGLQAMMVVPMVEGHSNLHVTLLGAQAMFTVVVQAQYNVYYGYTAQELQEFIADTVLSSVILPL